VKKLTGIFPALLTPFDKKGRIHEESLRKLVHVLLHKGVDGFYVCGSTGEVFLLSLEERKRTLSIVMDEVKGRAAVICHVGAIATHFSIELARHAAELGADAISSIPPFYYKFSQSEIIGYYNELADVGLPMIPYNFPALSGVTLTKELVRELRKHENIIGIKFTSSDMYQLERMKNADPDLLVYNGFDEMFLSGLAMGADGAIGSTFNFMPEKFLQIQKLFMQGNLEEARAEQASANAVIDALLKTGKLLNAQKYMIDLQGIPFGECRKPFEPLTEADKELLEQVWRQHILHEGRSKREAHVH
jgi:N-acetylneuraminate lyase